MTQYSKLARIYDTLYSFKNYEAEAKRLREIITEKKTSPGNALLDVACGTGTHLSFLQKYYAVEGIDLHARNARGRTRTSSSRSFSIWVTCAASTRPPIRYRHLSLQFNWIHESRRRICAPRSSTWRVICKPGGVLLIEPWLTEETWKPGGIHALFVDKPEFKIARMDDLRADGRMSVSSGTCS